VPFLEILREYRIFSSVKTQNMSALDLGCGTGDYLVKLPRNSIGIDISLRNLLLAKNRVRRNLILCDGSSLPFRKDLFDLVFCVNVLHYYDDSKCRRIISEANRVLKDGGKLILVVVHSNFPISWRTRDWIKLRLRKKCVWYNFEPNFFTANKVRTLLMQTDLVLEQECTNAGTLTVLLGPVISLISKSLRLKIESNKKILEFLATMDNLQKDSVELVFVSRKCHSCRSVK